MTETSPKRNKLEDTPKEFQYNSTNPFMQEVVEYIGESSHRKVVGHSWQDVLDKPTGELRKQKILVLGEQKVVDEQEYCKLYMDQIQRFFGLSKRSGELLNYVMKNVRYGQDKICLHYPDIKERLGMGKSTMHSCINQLLSGKILARAGVSGCYYINPAVVFKGDRVALVQQWMVDRIPDEYKLETMIEDMTDQEVQEH